MNGVVINVDPVIFHFAGFELRWYSLAIMVAMVVGVLVATKEARRKGISPDDIYSLMMWVLVGGLVGARLFHVVDRFDYYLANPSAIFGFQGLAIWGGVAGGGLGAAAYARFRGISVARLADVAAPGLLVGQIIGRIGCIFNGDAYGGPTTLPWGFIYTNPNSMIPTNLLGKATHPYPVYEMLWNGAVLLIVLTVGRRWKVDGSVFLTYLSLYAVGRFFLTFVREERIIFGGLQQAQLLAAAVFIVAMLVLAHINRPRKAPGRRMGEPEAALDF